MTILVQFSSLNRVQLFVTPWNAAHQSSLSITNSRGSPKPMSIKSVIPSNHLILCRPIHLPSNFSSMSIFSNGSALRLAWGGQSIGASASTSVLPMNTEDWLLLGWTGWISWQSKGLSRVFTNTTVQKHHSLALSFLYSPTLTSIPDPWKNQSLD